MFDSGNADIDELKRLEIETEMAVCYQNKNMKEVFDYCKNNKKKVVLVSDMYLEADIIEKILTNAGYSGYDEVYLSSQLQEKKSTGRLFDIVIQKEKVSPHKILHIGDNIQSDYIIPKKKGVIAWNYSYKHIRFNITQQKK